MGESGCEEEGFVGGGVGGVGEGFEGGWLVVDGVGAAGWDRDFGGWRGEFGGHVGRIAGALKVLWVLSWVSVQLCI